MTLRTLPASEWDRIPSDAALSQVIGLCRPDQIEVLVVEHDGQIVGCWAFLTIVHAEGVWIHPDHRGKSSVARRLWTGMQTLLRGKVSAVVTGAADDTIRALIEGHRGEALPPLYRLPIG